MRVVVLHSSVKDGASRDELDTLAQVEAVAASLRDQGHRPQSLQCGLDLVEVAASLKAIQPDVVFNLVESIAGAGRLIGLAPMLLEHLRLPYTGSPADAVYLTSSKLLTKTLLRLNGLPAPAWTTPEEVVRTRTLPGCCLIVKSVWEHASIGLEDESIIEPADSEDLARDMERRKEALGGSCFAEVYVPGREFNVSVLETPGGPEVLPPAEMLFGGYPAGKPKLVGYRAKWEESSFEFRHTGRSFAFDPVDGPLLEELSELALRCFRVFGLRGYARVDFRVDETGRPLILEVNANPCLSPDAGFTAATMQAGLDHAQVIQALVEAAVCHAGLGRASPGEGPLRESHPYLPTHGERETEADLGPSMRDHLTIQDRQAIERLVNATGFFSLAERAMVLELVDAWLRDGVGSGYHFIVASSGGDIVGFVCYGPVPATTAGFEMYWIAVHPHHQRRKIGCALLAKAERGIGSLGGKQIYVSTAGRPQYLPTRLFYETNGYRQAARLRDYHAPGDDRLVYVKILSTAVPQCPTGPH